MTLEQWLSENIHRLLSGQATKIEHVIDGYKITAYRMGDQVRIDIKPHL